MNASPSETIKSPVAFKGVVDKLTGPRYGRSFERFGTPTVLFRRKPALLKCDPDDLEAPTPDSAAAVYASSLTRNSTAPFDEEDKREASLRSILEGFS